MISEGSDEFVRLQIQNKNDIREVTSANLSSVNSKNAKPDLVRGSHSYNFLISILTNSNQDLARKFTLAIFNLGYLQMQIKIQLGEVTLAICLQVYFQNETKIQLREVTCDILLSI